jgi:hypothetical protein
MPAETAIVSATRRMGASMVVFDRRHWSSCLQ